MNDLEIDDDAIEATAFLAQLDEKRRSRCADCAQECCGHEIVISIAMGFQNAIRCQSCLADRLNQELPEFLQQIGQYIQRKDCFRQGWIRACEWEEQSPSMMPSCLHFQENPNPIASSDEFIPTESTQVDDRFDAGDMGCGDLVLALRIRLNAMAPNHVLALTATDPAAPVDLPAWCQMTGHQLLDAEHPHYLIRRKESEHAR